MPNSSLPNDTAAAAAACTERCNGMPGRVDGVSRRSFMQTLGLSAASAAAASHVEESLARSASPQEAAASESFGPEPFNVSLRINDRALNALIDPATTLLDALRSHFHLTGTKEICDRGACGGCTVLLDGQPINSCMLLAADAVGSEITTVEGLSRDGQLDPVQEAFIRHDALQCGYCTPGLVISSHALLKSNPKPTLDEIKHALSGNLCRCGTYTNVFNAVLDASGQKPLVDATIDAKAIVS